MCSFEVSIGLVVTPHIDHLGNRTFVITSHYVQACKSYGVTRKTMDRQRHMKTIPVHCMVGKSSCHLVCMSCSQLRNKPTGFLVTKFQRLLHTRNGILLFASCVFLSDSRRLIL